MIMNYRRAKKMILPMLVNAKSNEENLVYVPHVPFLDMEIVFYICPNVNDRPYTDEIVMVNNSHMERWGVNTDELYRNAMANAKDAQPAILYTMDGFLDSVYAWLTGSSDCRLLDGLQDVREQHHPHSQEYFLSNRFHTFGSTCLAYDGLLKEFAEKIGSFYMLPISIHEVTIIPAGENNRMEVFTAKVREYNETYMLSDHAYYYDAKKCAVIY